MSTASTPCTELKVSFFTLLKIVAVVVLFFAVLRLAPLLMLIFLASLLAVTLHPLVKKLERWLPRTLSLLLVTLLLLGGTTFVLVVLLPSIIEQMGILFSELPKLQTYINGHIPEHGFLHDLAGKVSSMPADPSVWGARLLTVGSAAVGGLLQVGILLIVSLYLLSDGPRAYSWFVAFFKGPTHAKLDQTAKELSKIIFAYIVGQLITSLFVFIFAFSLLTWLNVPAALALAGLAAIFDILPIIGFFLAVIPAMALALSVSAWTACLVGICYLGYHLLETYVIVPKVYGNRLRLSDLSVIVGLLAADVLAGIPGAIAVLPILAAYPIIERIWLVDKIGASVVKQHEQQADHK